MSPGIHIFKNSPVEIGACSEEGTALEGKAAATPESKEPQAKGAEG